MSLFQTPNRLEPVLADKEVLLTALNIKSMNFSEEETPGAEVLDEGDSSRPNGAPGSQHQSNDSIVEQLMGGPRKLGGKSSTPIIVDLAFASNVRFLDDHELYLDNVELYRVSYETGCHNSVHKPNVHMVWDAQRTQLFNMVF